MPTFRLGFDGVSHQVSASDTSVDVDGETFDVLVTGESPNVTVRVNGRPFDVELPQSGVTSPLTVSVSGRTHTVELQGVTLPGASAVRTPSATHLGEGEGAVVAPMTGRILRVLVRPGEIVKSGDLLLILEAMKMENEIRATRSGMVDQVPVAEGERVSTGQTLLVIGGDA